MTDVLHDMYPRKVLRLLRTMRDAIGSGELGTQMSPEWRREALDGLSWHIAAVRREMPDERPQLHLVEEVER